MQNWGFKIENLTAKWGKAEILNSINLDLKVDDKTTVLPLIGVTGQGVSSKDLASNISTSFFVIRVYMMETNTKIYSIEKDLFLLLPAG